MTDFDLSSYSFYLPPELIAERPVPDRHSSRLLVYDQKKDSITHTSFSKIGDFLPQNSTFVFNRSKVFPCRLIGKKKSGGDAEVFVLTLIDQDGLYPALIKASGKRKVGDEFFFGDLVASLEIVRGDGTFLVRFNRSSGDLIDELQEKGRIPIPPYIRGGVSDDLDRQQYQTVYAREVGSVAAPTAGLHFSETVLEDLKARGHKLASVTLHVGAGTFAAIKASHILDHKMHEEFYQIDEENLKLIQDASFRVAVGTTSLRTLESAWKDGNVRATPGLHSTSIFLHPGKEVHSIQALMTNFHLPESSLLILVSALIGREKTLQIYEEAIKERYRFFSYGDGMLILR